MIIGSIIGNIISAVILVLSVIFSIGLLIIALTPNSFEKMAAEEERKRIDRILDSLSDDNGNINIEIRVTREKDN